MSFDRIATSFLVTLVLIATGCSQQDPSKGEVKGLVLVDGQPVELGAVSFSPLDGQSSSSGGKIVNGQYSVQASTGVAKVAIRVPKVIGERKVYTAANSPMQEILKESLPPEYNDRTTLTFDVKAGVNEHNFEISTKKNTTKK